VSLQVFSAFSFVSVNLTPCKFCSQLLADFKCDVLHRHKTVCYTRGLGGANRKLPKIERSVKNKFSFLENFK